MKIKSRKVLILSALTSLVALPFVATSTSSKFSNSPASNNYYLTSGKTKQLLSKSNNSNVKLVVPTPIFRTDWGYSEIDQAAIHENKLELTQQIDDLIANKNVLNDKYIQSIKIGDKHDVTFEVVIILKTGYAFPNGEAIFNGKISFSEYEPEPTVAETDFSSMITLKDWIKQQNKLSLEDKLNTFLPEKILKVTNTKSVMLVTDDEAPNSFKITITLKNGYLFNIDNVKSNTWISKSIQYNQTFIDSQPVLKPVLAKNAIDYVNSEKDKDLSTKVKDLIANADVLTDTNIQSIKLTAFDGKINKFNVTITLKDNHFFQFKDETGKDTLESFITFLVTLSIQVNKPTLRNGFATTSTLKEWIPLVNDSGIVAQINMLFKDDVLTSANTASISVAMADEANNLFNITITLEDGYGFAGGEKTLTLKNIVFKQLIPLDLPMLKNQDKSTITEHQASILEWWTSLTSENQVNSVNDLLASPINVQAIESINISVKIDTSNQFTFTIILKSGYVFQNNNIPSNSWTSTPIKYEQAAASIIDKPTDKPTTDKPTEKPTLDKQTTSHASTIGLAIGLPVGALVVGLLIWFIILRVKTRKTNQTK